MQASKRQNRQQAQKSHATWKHDAFDEPLGEKETAVSLGYY